MTRFSGDFQKHAIGEIDTSMRSELIERGYHDFAFLHGNTLVIQQHLNAGPDCLAGHIEYRLQDPDAFDQDEM